MALTNQKHINFCMEYLKDFNITRAEAAAGYATKHPGRSGWRLLQKPEVQEFLADKKKQLMDAADIELMDIIRHLRDMAFFDIRDILSETGAIKPVSEWPDIACKVVSGMDVQTLLLDEDVATITKVKIPSREKNTENLGRYVGAFTDNMKVDTGDGVKKVYVFPGFKPGMAIPAEDDGDNGHYDGGNGRSESDDGGNGKYRED
jgi:phage terminase small subunit